MSECAYACALIEDQRGLLLELRSSQARHAAGQLTCFGGRREDGEDGLSCLQRELREELAWSPARDCFHLAVDLYQGSYHIASFWQLITEIPENLCCSLQHSRAIWVPWTCISAVPVATWHALVLAAWQRGEKTLQLPAVWGEQEG